jgi:hypothetical protein
MISVSESRRQELVFIYPLQEIPSRQYRLQAAIGSMQATQTPTTRRINYALHWGWGEQITIVGEYRRNTFSFLRGRTLAQFTGKLGSLEGKTLIEGRQAGDITSRFLS